jgi:LysR family transcriptional activator of nhaA
MMNYNHLYYFYRVAQAGGVTAAARLLRVTQPSLSAQIRTLEAALGARLFDRTDRRMRLTPAGHRYFAVCRRMFDAAEELERGPDARADGAPESLQLGAGLEVERPFLADVVAEIHALSGAVQAPRITLSSMPHAELLAQLRGRALDAIITNQPVYDDDLRELVSIRMPVGLAFLRGGEFRGLGRLRRAPAREWVRRPGLRWVLPLRGVRLRTEIDAWLEARRVAVTPTFESDVLGVVVRAVLDDIGVALLPLPYVRAQVRQERLEWQAPAQGFWQHRISLVVRANRPIAGALGALEKGFRRTVGAERLASVL